MTDDLVKRLRNKTTPTGFKDAVDEGTGDYFLEVVNAPDAVCIKAADRIEELQARVAELEKDLGCADAYQREWEQHCKTAEARIEELEAKLAKAVEVLEQT